MFESFQGAGGKSLLKANITDEKGQIVVKDGNESFPLSEGIFFDCRP